MMYDAFIFCLRMQIEKLSKRWPSNLKTTRIDALYHLRDDRNDSSCTSEHASHMMRCELIIWEIASTFLVDL